MIYSPDPTVEHHPFEGAMQAFIEADSDKDGCVTAAEVLSVFGNGM